MAQVANRSGVDSAVFISHAVFVPKQKLASGQQNWDLVSCDLNGDRLPDLVTASKLDGQVHVHLNRGNGAFWPAKPYPTQADNRSICIVDANQDGAPDLATVTLMGRLCLLINDGSGGFGRAQVMQSGVMAHQVQAADLDQDGFEDLIVAVVSENALHIHYGLGQGAFRLPETLLTGRDPRSVAIGDLQGDGRLDLVSGCDDGRIYLHLQEQARHFAKPIALRSGAANWALGLADLDNNGHLDIATASYLDKKLCVHLNLGQGRFAREQEQLSGDHNFDLAISDIDLDGDLDLITCSTVDEAINFHFNEGNGQFGPRIEHPSGNWNAGICVADFDGDGDPDIATASINDHALNLHRNLVADTPQETESGPCVYGQLIEKDLNTTIPRRPISLQNEQGEEIAVQMTDEQGHYRFCLPAGRSYQLVVRYEDYPLLREGFSLPGEDLEKDLYLSRPKASFIYGRVFDAETRQALARVPLTLNQAQSSEDTRFQTNANGMYRRELPFGKHYELATEVAGYAEARRFFDLAEIHHPQGLRVDLALHRPHPEQACVQGVVYDAKTGAILPTARLVFKNEAGETLRKVRVRADASYELCLPLGSYHCSALAKGFFFALTDFALADSHTVNSLQHDIYLDPLEKEAKIVLRQIYFDVDKATLRSESIEELERIREVLTQNPSLKVKLAGHTDSDASEAYNLSLSSRRAQAVVDYLTGEGIHAARLEAVGLGESQPEVPNDSPANKQLNRRTEFIVVDY